MFYSNKTPRCNISRALSPPTIKNINLRNTSWGILLLFNSRRISVSRRNFVTLLLLFLFSDKQEHQGVHTERSTGVRGRDSPGLPWETDRLDAHTAGAEGPLQVYVLEATA